MQIETRQSIVLTAGIGITAVLSMVYSVYVGRRLGVEQYADFTTAVALATLCCTALGPINGTVARFTAEYSTRGELGRVLTLSREVWRRVSRYGLLGWIVALPILYPLTRMMGFQSVLVALAAFGIIYLNLLLSVPRGVLRGLQRYGKYNTNIMLEAAARLAAGVALVESLRQAWAGIAAYVLALILVLVVSHWQLRSVWRGHQPERVDGGAIRRFTLPLFLFTATAAGFQNGDMLFAKYFLADAQAGLYGAASMLVRVLGVLAMPFNTLMLPLMAIKQTEGRAFVGPFLRVCAYFMLLASVPLAACVLWSDWILVRVYGQAFAGAAPLLAWLAGARLIGYLSDLTALACVSTHRFDILYVYLPGLAVQVLALCVWHQSPRVIVTVVFATQLLTAAAMLSVLLARPPGRAQSS